MPSVQAGQSQGRSGNARARHLHASPFFRKCCHRFRRFWLCTGVSPSTGREVGRLERHSFQSFAHGPRTSALILDNQGGWVPLQDVYFQNSSDFYPWLTFLATTMILSPQRIGKNGNPTIAWNPPREPKKSFCRILGTTRM